MKNILLLVLSSLTISIGFHTSVSSSVPNLEVQSPSTVVKTKSLALSEVSSSLIGRWKSQNPEIGLMFSSNHFYNLYAETNVPQKACTLIQTKIHTGKYSVNGNTITFTEELYAVEEVQGCGSAVRNLPTRKRNVRGKPYTERFTVQNNGQTLVMVSSGKQIVFQKVSSEDF